MSQALIGLAVTLDHESLIGGLEAADSFEFPSFLDSMPFNGITNFDIFNAFSMGMAGAMICEVTSVDTT